MATYISSRINHLLALSPSLIGSGPPKFDHPILWTPQYYSHQKIQEEISNQGQLPSTGTGGSATPALGAMSESLILTY